jgi:hypothetical protein
MPVLGQSWPEQDSGSLPLFYFQCGRQIYLADRNANNWWKRKFIRITLSIVFETMLYAIFEKMVSQINLATTLTL